MPSAPKSSWISTLKSGWTIGAVILALLGTSGTYSQFHPHVTLDPALLLNPVDPFSTQFNVTNQSRNFAIRRLHTACPTMFVETSHQVRLMGLPPLPAPEIPILEAGATTTVNCRSWVAGLGAGMGDVTTAYIEIDVAYQQDWWPFATMQRFPFRGVIDSQKAVHWTHITPSELTR
jgi:hypothetical protein